MENIRIGYNRKIVICLILTLLIGGICFGIIPAILMVGVIIFMSLYRNPVKFKWIRRSIDVFELNEKGIKLFSLEKEIPWEDIENYHIKYGVLRNLLCIKLRKENVDAFENSNFYNELSEKKVLKKTELGEKIIEYPYRFIECSTDTLKSEVGLFLKAYSTYYQRKIMDKVDVKSSTNKVWLAGGFCILFTNIFAKSGVYFLVSCGIAIPIMLFFHIWIKNTIYLSLSKEGFEFPKTKFRLNWVDIKLVEVQTSTRDNPGALIIWFNNIESFIDRNPKFFKGVVDNLDYDEKRFRQTGRLRVKCGDTDIGEYELRDLFLKYIDKYGENTNQNVGINIDKIDMNDNNISEYNTDTIADTISDGEDVNDALMLEFKKLVQVKLGTLKSPCKMVLLKEEGKYCLGAKVVGLNFDGYCICLKDDIRSISYYQNFYNELLEKEYYFILNTDLYLDLRRWDTILNSYHVNKHLIEVKTIRDNYKGKYKEVQGDSLVLNSLIIEDKATFDEIDIELKNITYLSFETSELTLLEKYVNKH